MDDELTLPRRRETLRMQPTGGKNRLADGQKVCQLEVDEGNTKNAGSGGFVRSAQYAGACDA
jgi:hypothetical protein